MRHVKNANSPSGTLGSKSAYRVRLRARLSKGLTTEDVSRTIEFDGRSVTIASQDPKQALSKTTWVILSAGGFESESDAHDFGEKLRQALVVGAVASRLGVDVGLDTPTSWMDEDFARSLGLIKSHERVSPNIHGLMVLPDDGNTRFPVMNVGAVVTAAPDHLLGAIASLDRAPLLSPALREAMTIVNMALMNAQPIASLALALSAVEALGQDEDWTSAQRELIDELAIRAESLSAYTPQERAEVADALRRSLHRVGLRQGVLRILAKLDLTHLKKEWDRIYGLRSSLFHGTYRPTEPEIAQLANDATTLSAIVVLTLAKHEGLVIPKIASTHFLALDEARLP